MKLLFAFIVSLWALLYTDPLTYAASSKQPSHIPFYPLELREYKLPVKIKLNYIGGNNTTKAEDDERWRRFMFCFEWKKTVKKYKDFLKEGEYFPSNFRKYILKNDILAEKCDVTSKTFPFYVGYIVIYKDLTLDFFPADTYATLYLFRQVQKLSLEKGVSLPYYSGITQDYIRRTESNIDYGVEGMSGSGGYAGRVIPNTDFLFVPAVVQYFENFGFRVTKLEEGARLSPAELQESH